MPISLKNSCVNATDQFFKPITLSAKVLPFNLRYPMTNIVSHISVHLVQKICREQGLPAAYDKSIVSSRVRTKLKFDCLFGCKIRLISFAEPFVVIQTQ